MKEEIRYKINVVDTSKRRRTIKDNIEKKKSYHKESFRIKGKFKQVPIITLHIDLPVYHLNNGRTRAEQRNYIVENNKKDDFFEKNQENNAQQRIQHEILVRASKDSTANIFAELKKSKDFREDSPLLLESNGMVINGNRRLAALRELYKSDVKTFNRFKEIPCAIIVEHLSAQNIKEIENYLQVKKENKQEYDWVSLALEIKNERDRLNLTNKQIAVNMGKNEQEVERYYNLINVIDTCLEEDWKKPGEYDLIMKQEQLWKNTEERAFRTKNPAEKAAIYRFARMISLNSTKLGDRAYKFASVLQKKKHLKTAVNYLADRYHVKTPKIKSDKKSDDPLDVIEPNRDIINISTVNKLPIKKNTEEVILQTADHLTDAGDKRAALKYSQDLLNKISTLSGLPMDKKFRSEIVQNLRRLIKKAQSIIDKIK